MANGTPATTSGTRVTAPRESFSIPIIPVDEKRFESEMRRMDSAVADERKNREKFETRIEKAVNDLRGDMNALRAETNARFDKLDARFDKIDARFNRMEDRLWWIFGTVILSILLPVILKYL